MPMSFFLIYMLIIWHFKAFEKTHSEMEHPVLQNWKKQWIETGVHSFEKGVGVHSFEMQGVKMRVHSFNFEGVRAEWHTKYMGALNTLFIRVHEK